MEIAREVRHSASFLLSLLPAGGEKVRGVGIGWGIWVMGIGVRRRMVEVHVCEHFSLVEGCCCERFGFIAIQQILHQLMLKGM